MSDPVIHAIPTVYRGLTFRSRLEAKWAAMFDQLEWPWEYEPIDLDGYIPDFILQFHKPVLAEVKPAMTVEDCKLYTQKIERSGWKGDALIFGAALKLDQNSFTGPACCYYGQYESWGPEHSPADKFDWAVGELHLCEKCGRFSIYHTDQCFRCIVTGCYDGNSYLGPVNFETIHQFWARATELTRYEAA